MTNTPTADSRVGEPLAYRWQTSHTEGRWHYAEKVSFAPRDIEMGIIKNVTPLYADTLTSPAQKTVTDDMVEVAARAFDPFSFASWQQSYDYEMAKSSDEAEAKAFADWCMGKRIDEARSGARAALTAALSSKGA